MAEMSTLHERAVVFGEGRKLVGITTKRSPKGMNNPNKLVIVFLNAGVVHHIGPNRLHVVLARQLAGHGFQIFRFDLAGIGDSDPPGIVKDIVETGLEDIRMALDYLGERGADRFILIGLCSGANNSLRYAFRDSRVIGSVVIDPRVFPTLKTHLIHYGGRLLRAKSWVKILTGKSEELNNLIQRLQKGVGEEIESSNPDDRISRETMTKWLTNLVERRVELLFIFTGSLKTTYNYSNQFKDVFYDLASSKHIRTAYIPDCDHTFSLIEYRKKLVDTLIPWLQKCVIANIEGVVEGMEPTLQKMHVNLPGK